jgi:DNA-binding NtrC family response regulator
MAGDERPRTMEEIERDAILRTLDEVGGNRTQAAQRLGIGLRTLQRKLQEYRRQAERASDERARGLAARGPRARAKQPG